MSRPYRVILHVFPSQSWGGAEIYSVQLAWAQQQAGEKVYFWAYPGSPIATEASGKGIKVITERLGIRLDLSLFRFNRVLAETEATHVHLHWSGGMWSLGILRFFRKFKLLLHNHMWIKHSKKDPLHMLVYRNLDKFIVAGEQARKAALNCLALSEQQIEICPYAVTTEAVYPFSKERMGFNKDDFIIGIFSRLDRQKGILELLEAAQPLAEEYPDLRILIMGNPTLKEKDSLLYCEELKEFVEDNFDAEVVQFHGNKENFREWLASCNVLALPSYHESYSLIILEAFAVGVPVISTLAGGTPDLIKSERGWLVEPRNVDSLYEGLKRIMESRHQIPSMGLMARDYVTRKHTFEAVIERLRTIYD